GGIALLHALHVIGGGTAHDPIDDRAAGKEPKLPGELAASAIPYAVALPFALAELDAEAVRIAGDLVRGALPGEIALARPPLRSGDPIPPLLHGDLDVSPAGRALLPPRLPPGQRLGRPLAEKLRRRRFHRLPRHGDGLARATVAGDGLALDAVGGLGGETRIGRLLAVARRHLHHLARRRLACLLLLRALRLLRPGCLRPLARPPRGPLRRLARLGHGLIPGRGGKLYHLHRGGGRRVGRLESEGADEEGKAHQVQHKREREGDPQPAPRAAARADRLALAQLPLHHARASSLLAYCDRGARSMPPARASPADSQQFGIVSTTGRASLRGSSARGWPDGRLPAPRGRSPPSGTSLHRAPSPRRETASARAAARSRRETIPGSPATGGSPAHPAPRPRPPRPKAEGGWPGRIRRGSRP